MKKSNILLALAAYLAFSATSAYAADSEPSKEEMMTGQGEMAKKEVAPGQTEMTKEEMMKK